MARCPVERAGAQEYLSVGRSQLSEGAGHDRDVTGQLAARETRLPGLLFAQAYLHGLRHLGGAARNCWFKRVARNDWSDV